MTTWNCVFRKLHAINFLAKVTMSVPLLGIAYIAGGNSGKSPKIPRGSAAKKVPADKENTPRITIPPATQAVFGKSPVVRYSRNLPPLVRYR